MVVNKLFFNPSKAEFLICPTAQRLKKFGWLISLKLGDSFDDLADATHVLFLTLLCLSLSIKMVFVSHHNSTLYPCYNIRFEIHINYQVLTSAVLN